MNNKSEITNMPSLTAVVLGATGLVGEQLVQQLLNDAIFSKVRILVRKQVNLSHPKLEIAVTDFEDSTKYRHNLGKGNCIFCCIGTTIKNVKGDKNAYRKIDVGIAVNAAKMGKDAGFTKYLLISSVGANARSKNYYLRFKGEAEQEIANVRFNSFHVFRPSILFGKRKEFRLGERLSKVVMQGFSVLFLGKFKRYKGIFAATVAHAMITTAKSEGEGMFVHHYEDMTKACY